MSRRSLVALVILGAALFVGCAGRRRVDLDFRTPRSCAEAGPDGGTLPEPDCPVGGVRSIKTEVRAVDGTIVINECVDAPPGFCTLADLADVQLVTRFDPIDGAEITMRGFDGPACSGRAILSCDSFGESVIALGAVDRVTLWCDCPLAP